MRKLVCSVLALAGSVMAAAWDYPAARRSDHVDEYQGVKVADPYRWMEDIDSPETQAWIAAERKLTGEALATMPERAPIRARLMALWNFPHFGLPFKEGGHTFFTKNDGLQNQSVLYVQDEVGSADGGREARPAASEARVLIDPNTLASDGTVALGVTAASRDGKWLAYSLKAAGSDWEEVFVRDVATGKDTGDRIRWVKFSNLAWTRDSRGFFYGRFPAAAKGDQLFGKLSRQQIYYHVLGTPQAEDRLVFELPEHPDWLMEAGVSDDGRFLILTIAQPSVTQNGLYYRDLGDPERPVFDGPVVKLLDAFDANYGYVHNDGETFFVQTTAGAPRGKIVAIDLKSPAPERWRTVVPESADNMDAANFFGGRFVVTTMHDVKSRLAVFAADGKPLGEIALPGIGAVTGVSGRDDDPELFFDFSSFLSPPTLFRHDLASGTNGVFQEAKVDFDAARYTTEQVWVASKDGTKIPMFITHRKDLARDGRSPAWLYGYGGFNISIRPQFAVPPLVWLELGGVFAQANMRGGGEFGEAWHLAGTKERKQNVFDDFIAAADWLVAKGYTSHERLVVQGRSNGGLLIGAVINQRPDLAAVAIPQVGVMDMLRYHKFTIGAAWASDYGTSETAEGFRYLRAYSPLHNITPGAKYPAVLITTGDHDDRVYPAHSFKYAATLQAAVAGVKSDRPSQGANLGRPVLIRIESNAGHGGSSGTTPVSKTIDEWADMMGFAAHEIGMRAE
jgi:prolyl oligopeptidase